MKKKKWRPHIGAKSVIFLVICAVLLAADLVTKYLEETQFWNFDIIKGWVEISNTIHNPGCAFSFLSDNPEIGQPVLISLTVALLVLLGVGYIFIPERFTLLKLAMAIVIAGAIGNLFDRCYTAYINESIAEAYVRDWFGLNMLFNGNLIYCNLADFWIVIGAILVVVDLLFFNEYSVFPLTKKAREAQANRKREDDEKDMELDDDLDDGFDDEVDDWEYGK